MSFRRLVLLALPLILSGCSTLQSFFDPLSPGADTSAAFILTGKGVQQFQCTADAAGRYWKFITPQAQLSDEKGRVVARQGSDGSFFANDGSMLSAKIEKYAQDSVAGNLRDLVYKTTHRGRPGLFSGISHVKRSNGQGGIPLTRCSASQLGTTLKVPFTATFTFYRAE